MYVDTETEECEKSRMMGCERCVELAGLFELGARGHTIVKNKFDRLGTKTLSEQIGQIGNKNTGDIKKHIGQNGNKNTDRTERPDWE